MIKKIKPALPIFDHARGNSASAQLVTVLVEPGLPGEILLFVLWKAHVEFVS